MVCAHWSERARRRGRWLLAASTALLLAACDGGAPARIAYPYPSLGPGLTRVAQPAIDARGRSRVAEIPEPLMAGVTVRPGYAGDIDFAVAMTAVPGLVAAVGPQSSRATLLTAPVYAESEIPLIAATATSRRLRDAGPWVFQLAPDDEEEGAFIASFILDHLNVRRVTIFYLVADEYGVGLRAGVVQALDARGVAPVDEVGITEASPFPRRVAASLKRAVPDVVVVAARTPEAIAITRSLHGLLPGAAVLVGDAVPLNPAFIRAVGSAAPSLYGVTWWSPSLPDSLSRSFVAGWERANRSSPSASDAMYYDAIMLAAQAVREVGPSRAAVRRYLGELGTSRPSYQGVTGPISFAPNRATNLLATRIDNGVATLVNRR